VHQHLSQWSQQIVIYKSIWCSQTEFKRKHQNTSMTIFPTKSL
jgi:hypothetical protein